MLEIRNVSMTFNDATPLCVLDSISLCVPSGEFACVLGPSGSGKSVFLFLVAGFLKPTSGEILVDAAVVDRPGRDRVLVFQDSALFPWRTVRGNVAFGLEKSARSTAERRELVSHFLELVDLRRFEDYYPHKLSGGQKQRVALARALIGGPKVLLLDEPFSALDAEARRYMRRSLERIWLRTKTTTIMVTHSVREAMTLADAVYVFSRLPASVIGDFRVESSRPRDTGSDALTRLSQQIGRIKDTEFSKRNNEDDRDPVDRILREMLE